MSKVVIQFTSDSKDAEKGIERINREMTKLREENRKLRETSRSSNTGTISELAKVAAAYVSVSKAVGFATQALSDMEQTRKAAGQRLNDAVPGMGALAKLARGDVKKLQSLVNEALQLRAEGGASTLDEAAKTVFALHSAGAQKHSELFRDLKGIVANPEEMIVAATAIKTSMGEKNTGDLRQIVSKALAASEASPASDEGILIGASRAAGIANQLKISAEELLGATGVLSEATGSAEEAGTQIASFLTAATKNTGFQGLRLEQMLDKVANATVADLEKSGVALSRSQKRRRKEKLTEDELVEYLGRKEALLGFSTLNLEENRQKLRQSIADQKVAAAEDRVGAVAASKWGVPEIATPLLRQQAEGKKEVGMTRMGTLNELATAAEQHHEARMREAEWSEANIWLRNWKSGTRRFLFGDEDRIEQLGRHVQGENQANFDRAVRQLDPALFERMIEKLSEIEANQRRQRIGAGRPE